MAGGRYDCLWAMFTTFSKYWRRLFAASRRHIYLWPEGTRFSKSQITVRTVTNDYSNIVWPLIRLLQIVEIGWNKLSTMLWMLWPLTTTKYGGIWLQEFVFWPKWVPGLYTKINEWAWNIYRLFESHVCIIKFMFVQFEPKNPKQMISHLFDRDKSYTEWPKSYDARSYYLFILFTYQYIL